jgi:hypothetical protein
MRFLSVMLLGLMVVSPVVAKPAAKKPVIRSQADVPETRFKLSQPASIAFSGPAFAEAMPAIRAEAERLLSGYQIEDPVVAQRLHTGWPRLPPLKTAPQMRKNCLLHSACLKPNRS